MNVNVNRCLFAFESQQIKSTIFKVTHLLSGDNDLRIKNQKLTIINDCFILYL